MFLGFQNFPQFKGVLSFSSMVHVCMNAFSKIASDVTKSFRSHVLSLHVPKLHCIQSTGGHVSSPGLYFIQGIDCIKRADNFNAIVSFRNCLTIIQISTLFHWSDKQTDKLTDKPIA